MTIPQPTMRAERILISKPVLSCGPPARQGVPSYRVVIDGGDVKIEI
jgi:hypothetical protein